MRLARHGHRRAVVLLAVDLQEVVDEQRDVVAPLRQGGAGHRDHVEPVEEVLAEAAGFDLGLEVAVGRGDQAEVRALRGAAERFVLALLQHAQQLHLHADRQLADLVEEQRAAVGLREAPGALLRRRR